MNLSINAMSLSHGVLRLKNVVDLTHSLIDTASNNTLCGSYSGMSELSELGATHGCVIRKCWKCHNGRPVVGGTG